jgi:hypothetical protein
MQEWIDLDLSSGENEIVIGTEQNALIRPKTKNLVVGPEKCMKTTFMLRLMAGLSCGETTYPSLPVARQRKVLYLHGELSTPEIKDRTIKASSGLKGPYTHLFQGRTVDTNLITEAGQAAIVEIVKSYEPDDLVLDPWQSFIAGSDENSFKEISRATKFCDELIEQFGVTLWIPIHLGKDRMRGARGHSAVLGWRDTEIRLSRDAFGVEVTVDPRWAKPPEPFRLRFDAGTLWPDSRVIHAGQTAHIRAYVEQVGGAATKEEVGKHLKLSGDALRKALKRAEQAGAVQLDQNLVNLQSS